MSRNFLYADDLALAEQTMDFRTIVLLFPAELGNFTEYYQKYH